MNLLFNTIKVPQKMENILKEVGFSECAKIDALLESCPELETSLYKSLAKQSNIPFIRLDNKTIPEDCFCKMPEALLKLHKMIPFSKINGHLHMAFENPYPSMQYEDLKLYHSGKIIPHIATRSEILQRIEKHYRKDAIEKLHTKSANTTLKEEELNYHANDPTVRLVNSFIKKAIQEKSSDIHIEPKEDQVVIRFRINGDMIEYDRLEEKTSSKIITRIKVMGGMDIAEFRKCQDGKFEFDLGLEESEKIDIRVSIIPTIFGEKMVLRILNRQRISLKLDQLGFTATQLRKIESLLQYSNGMVLCCGPTGSGKSTTLYSMIEGMKHKKLNVTSIEDPVEYKMPSINQILVNDKAHITFANTLKYVLRQDPDVIMIGEIRDKDTVDLAIRASITGHLVLSTLHTKNAVSTITRLLDMGVEPYYINAALGGVIAQRLVKKICPNCKTIYHPSKEETLMFEEINKVPLYQGEGCEECNYTGSQERILVSEVLELNDAIKTLVVQGFDQAKFKKELGKIHKDSLQANCKALLLQGSIALEEFKQFSFMDLH
ncbi:GspE/PulE family protein [Isachenkonia alkalipeptolytica]|uniref:Type II/IV secretion system protein n=1 Tax=Isachenkonia alkalipeptolytica TaxID=2565777 RepID=A0AA44BFT3_9CLOT|nr:GspE/PulE family protein [Isachenkonia alkalipeptolytica]NBG88796.1 type II/IV secretion system protein [Isachenkonia alkalipeptolytica]